MSEFRRFLQSKMLLIWAAVLLLNAVLLIGAHGTESESAHIKERVLQTAVETEEGETYAEKVQAAVLEHLAAYRETYGQEGKVAQEYRDGFTKAREAAVYPDGYLNIVENRIAESERALKAGFYRTGSAEWTSLQAGLRDQREYLNYQPALVSVEWLDVLLSYLWTPAMLLGMLLMTVLVFFDSSQRGLRPVLFASKNGRQGLFIRRLILLVLEALIGAVLLYGETAAVLLGIYGGTNSLSAPAISLERLLFNAGDLTILQYLIRLTLFSAAGCLALSLIAWVLGSFISNRAAALLAFFAVFGIEFLLFSLISNKTAFRFLHYLNIYPLLLPMEALTREYWGYDLGVQLKSVSVLLTGLVFGLISVYLLVRKSMAYESAGRPLPRFEKTRSRLLKTFAAAPAFLKEVRKALISEKSLFGLAILLIVILEINVGHRIFYDDPVQAYLKGFYEKAYGLSWSDELDAIGQDYERVYEEAIANADPSTYSGASLIQNQTQLIEGIRGEIERLKRLSEEGISARAVNPYDYQAYMGSPQESQRTLITLCEILAAVLISMSCFSYEREKHMNQLIASCEGRKRWFRRKILVRFSLTLLFMLIAEGIYAVKIAKIYTFTGLLFPVKSLSLFEGFAVNPPIIVFLILVFLLKTLLLISLTFLTAYLSAKLKGKASAAMLLILTVPTLFWLLGIRSLRRVSIAHYVSIFPWIQREAGIRAIGYIGAAVFIAAVFFIIIRLDREQERKGITCG